MTTDFYPINEFVFRRPRIDYKNVTLDDLYLRNIIDSDLFQESIYYASPELYLELRKYIKGIFSEKKKNKMTGTLYKYLQRMHYRCTPFGTFALCGSGCYSEDSLIPNAQNIRLHYRYDYQFLYEYLLFLFNKCFSIVKHQIIVCTNQTVSHFNNYYYLNTRGDEGDIIEIKLPRSDLLDFILDLSQYRVSCKQIVQQCHLNFEVDDEDIYNYIQKLIVNGLLLTDLNIETISNDSFAQLYNKLKDVNVPLLRNMKETLEVLNSNVSFVLKRNAISSLYTEACKVGIKINKNQIIQVDSFSDTKALINCKVKENLKEWFNILAMINTPLANPLSNFVRRYVDKYDEMEISVLMALDKRFGIGYHSILSNTSTLIEKINKTSGSKQTNSDVKNYNLSIIEQIVLNKIIESDSISIKKVNLLKSDFDLYDHSKLYDFPNSFSCIYSIVGYDDMGPIISGISFSGPSASCLLTRFADGLNSINKIISIVGENEIENNKNSILAEISHLTKPHAGNVQMRPNFRKYKISYLMYFDNNEKFNIDIKDLFIKISNGKIHIFSSKLNKEIIPCFSSAYNYKFNSSDIYQFLGDIQQQHSSRALFSRFDSLLSMLRHIPRICYKNIIVFPESWLIKNTWKNMNETTAIENFKSVHENLKMPSFISFNQGDNYFIININYLGSIKEFINLTKNLSQVIVTEFLPLSKEFKHYDTILEVVQPFIKKVK
ncbi:MAG: lantibiotic dehydratase [Muribaculaceae bacterium]|nr:lantibiotic dehydratase [Muribaculaceae bacterium]